MGRVCEMARASAVGQGGTQKVKKVVCPKTSAAVKAKIVAASANGKTLREIARETKKSVGTVSRVVQSLNKVDVIAQGREAILTLADKALESYEYALENEEDGRLAERYLARMKILDNEKAAREDEAKPEVDNRTTEQKIKDLKDQYLIRAIEHIRERNKIFGTPLPEVDEIVELHPVKKETEE
jgi:transcriptional regulator with XRE-family HTH domain